jgi:adenylate cyclase
MASGRLGRWGWVWRSALVGSLVAAPLVEAADAHWHSLAFRLRGQRRPPPALVILDVDEASLGVADRLPPEQIAASPLWRRMNAAWPWPRALQAELAALVLERGARQVVFTLLYPQPSRFGTADDQAFVERLRPWRERVVLPAGYGLERDPASGLELLQLRRPVVALGPVGLDALLEGPGGSMEAIPGGAWQQQALAGFPLPHPPALAYASARRSPPTADLGIDFPGPAGTVPVVSAWEVLQQPPGFWRERIVVFGRTPSRLADRRPSPFGPLSSVELQAAALATVLDGRGFRPLPLPGSALLLLGWGALALVLLARPGQAGGTAATAMALAAVGLGGGWLAWLAGWWLPVTALLAAPLAGGGGRAFGQWLRESRERAYLHQVLARRISPSLLADILREPGPLGTQLGGSRTRCVVLFADLVGFTPLCERLPPPALFALLNRYFEAIAAAVIAEEGLLDKFIGDALMADFGVPRSRGDAAEALAAVRAALAMQAALERLNGELMIQGQPTLRQGIGIHVGEVIAGNLGSAERLEFSVVGATVNLASRLERLSRRYPHCPVLISGEVLALLPDQLEVDSLGEHRLEGWSRPIAVYGLRGLRISPPSTTISPENAAS